MARDWGETGSKIVLSGADFILGANKAFGKLGARLKRGKFEDFIETLCAIVGDIAKQNGELLLEERNAFKKFLMDKRDVKAFTLFEPDELVEKMKSYAVLAFLGETDKITLAVKNIEQGSLEAQLLIIAAISVAGADGEVDKDELSRIEYYAEKFKVDINEILKGCGVETKVNTTETTTQQTENTCKLCGGKGCMMCQ